MDLFIIDKIGEKSLLEADSLIENDEPLNSTKVTTEIRPPEIVLEEDESEAEDDGDYGGRKLEINWK